MTEDTNETTTEAVADTLPAKGKSIIDPKYRGKYKTPDWLGQLLLDNTSSTKVVAAKPATEATEQVGKIGETGYKPAKAAQEAQPAKIVKDGVDVNKLFALARENGLNVDKFETQRETHGFDGRFRMTVRNMLQTVVKQRHGLLVDGDFVVAPPEFLLKANAPTVATHNQDGTKIAKAKAEVAPPTGEPESKLIKASEVTGEANEGEDPVPSAKAKKKR